MDKKLLRSSIEVLKKLRKEQQGNVKKSVLKKLDKVIADLESIQQAKKEISSRDLLILLGTVLEKLPAVVELIRFVASVTK